MSGECGISSRIGQLVVLCQNVVERFGDINVHLNSNLSVNISCFDQSEQTQVKHKLP
jgi:hypothetical protein